jgi:hypothetical protein
VAYANNDLSSEAMLEFEMHLAACHECFEYVSELRRVRSAFRELALLRRLAPRPVEVPSEAVAVACTWGETAARDWLEVKAGLAFCAREFASAGDQLSRQLDEWLRKLEQASVEALERMSVFIRNPSETVRVSRDAVRAFGAVLFKRLQFVRQTPAFVGEMRTVESKGEGPETKVQPRLDRVEIQLQLASTEILIVVVRGLPEGVEPMAVMLVPKDSPQEARVEILKPVNGGWMAKFRGVKEQRDYAIVLEPLRGGGSS